MSTQKMTVILVSMALAILAGLLYLAIVGNVWAVGILFSGWTLVCVIIGYGLAVWQQSQAAAREQQAFVVNARENLQIMSAMQTVQNKQNQTLMAQLNQAARLPAPADQWGLSVEDGIFSELES